MDEVTKRRLAYNEAVFRAINEQVLALEEQFRSRDGGFVCECADAECTETVSLPLDEYERIHANERTFVVVPGHERKEIETVLERHDSHLIVEKKIPVPELHAQ